MSRYEVEVNRLRKEIGKFKSEIEDLEDERQAQEEELMELRFGKDVMVKEINELKSFKKVVEDKMYEQINKRVNDERRKLEECQALLIKTQEELTKLKREKSIQDDELEQEKHMVDTLKSQNHQMAIKLKEDRYLDTVNKYQETRKKQMQELKKTKEQLAETKRQAEHIMAENKVLRKLANVPENYGFDLEDVKIAEQEKLEDYKKQVRFLEREIEQLEEDRTNLRSRLRATALMKNDGSHLLVDATFKKEELFEKVKQQLINENTSLKNEVQELGQELQNKEMKKGAPSDKMSDDALKQMQAYQEEIKKHLSSLVNNQNVHTEQMVQKQDNQKLKQTDHRENEQYAEYAHHKQAPQPKAGGFGNLSDIREGYSSKFKQNIQVDMYDLYSEGGFDQVQVKHEIAQLQLTNIELIKTTKEKEHEYKNLQDEVRLMQENLKQSLLIQDKLFVNHYRKVQEFKQIQEQNQKEKDKAEEELLFLQQKYNILEQFRQVIEQSGIESEGTLEEKLAQMTKRTAILDVNMIKLARKYKALEEEYMSIKDQYINADNIHSEHELEMKTKILTLQGWKKSAQIQMKILFEQSVNSSPKEDFLSMVERNSSLNDQIANLKIEVADQRKQIADYRGKDREILDKEEQIKILQDEINDINLELDILKKRLEEMDPSFKRFQECFDRIIKQFNETRISPLKFFQLMSGDIQAPVSKLKFEQAMLQHLNIELKEGDINVIFKFIDIDCTDTLEYNEFLKKLRRRGVNIRNEQEQELYKLYENMLKANLTLKQMYDLFDSDNDGCITKGEMKIGFERFMRTKSDETVDFIFKLCDTSGEGKVTFNEWQSLFENTVKDSMLQQTLTQNLELDWKKEVMIQVHEGCISSGYQLLDLYKIIDIGDKETMTKYDLRNLMQNLKVNLNQSEVDALFNDIDADGSQEIDYSELLHYIREAKREKDKIQRQIDIKKRADKMNEKKENETKKLDEEIYKLQEHNQQGTQISRKEMLITMLELKLTNLQKKYDMQSVQTNNQEKQNFKLKTRLKEQEKDLENAKKEYYKERQRAIEMQNRIQSCITKEESESLNEYNKKLQIEVVELKSALKTFKSLYSSTSEQIQVLKTTIEKYKHEHDIYQGAIKEMQSQSDDRSLIGRLYHQVMLGHWEVGEMHAKYQKILENYQQSQMETQTIQTEYSKLEVDYRFLYRDFDEKMKSNLKEIISLKGKLIPTVNLSKIEELHNKMAELCQIKIELEVTNRKIREENYQLTLKVDYYETQMEGVDKLKEDLDKSHSDELQQKLITYSTKISELKLESMRNKRETMLAQEKESYFQRLNMQNQEQIKDFEKQLSDQHMKFAERETYWRSRQGEVLKTLAQLSEKEIQWKEETQKKSGDQMKQIHDQNQQRRVGFKGQAKKSSDHLQGSQGSDDENDDVIQKEFGIKLQPVKAQEVQILQQEAVKHQIEKIELLKQIDDLKMLCQSLDGEKIEAQELIEVLKQGNADLIHKQSREVEITKESIEKITKNAITEESEKLAMMAQQTIETLSKVIQDKNQALVRKEKFIDKIQKEFLEDKQKDNEEIRRLNNMYVANNMTKTDQIDVIQVEHENESIQTTMYWEEVGKLLKEKDQKIAELADMYDSEIKEVQKFKRKSEDLYDELVLVSQELQIEKQRNNIGTLKKQIEALQNLNKLKDEQIKNFKSNLQTLKDEFKLLTAKPEEMRNNMEDLKKQRDTEKKGKIDVEQQLNKAVDAIKKINMQVLSQRDEVENLNLKNNQNQTYISQLEFDNQKLKEAIKIAEKQILVNKQSANKKIDEQKINDIMAKDKSREKEMQELRMKNMDIERQLTEYKRPKKAKKFMQEESKDQ